MRSRTRKKMTPQWSRLCAKKKNNLCLSLTYGRARVQLIHKSITGCHRRHDSCVHCPFAADCCFILLSFSRAAEWLITGLHNYSTITVCAMCAFNRRNISLISPQLSACSLYRNRTCNNCIMPSAAGPEWPRALRTLAAL